MNKTIVLLLSIFSLISCKTSEVGILVEKGLLIQNAQITSPENQTMSPDNFIVVDGDEIVYVGKDKPNLKGSFTIIDARGRYIIPGLIDGHVHVTGTDALSDEEELDNPEIVKKFREQLPKSYLYFGYTTLIDLGTAKPERLTDFQKTEIRPDLYYAGGGAVIGNGYGLSNWKDDIPNFIYQENEDYPIPEKYLKENHTPKAVAERIAASGAIVLKTYYEPGFDPTQPRFPTPSKALMEELKTEAHKNNLVLVVHGNSLEAHQFLGNAKVDIVAHGLWNWGSHRLDSTNAIPEEIKQVLDVEIENNVGYMPTLQVINGLRELTDSDYLNNPELEHVFPKNLIEYYKANSNVMYANVFGGAPKNIIATNFNRISNQGKINLKYMFDHGGNILFGTDTPSSPTFGNPPGYNGYLEMLEMEKAGVPPSKILAMATIENAKAFNLDQLYGTVESGKKANLLVLNKNPLQDITAYNDIEQVIINGIPFDRKTFSAQKGAE
ncbi:amidohydrolase family protein [Muricauda sp. 334s03]|uniref:Amidohydrolase family protein n=1 Tax=Flagellimonas yonaguniensis TaxID=3031325 RepID=A0ABT5XYY3_9FLAO|nr:amidohydrolase family protein [[Muricauda] yonaguniensis]MDF0716394.1 amidohydrolase family protein [[Muricauda] yonaguniensis]